MSRVEGLLIYTGPLGNPQNSMSQNSEMPVQSSQSANQ